LGAGGVRWLIITLKTLKLFQTSAPARSDLGLWLSLYILVITLYKDREHEEIERKIDWKRLFKRLM